MSSINRLFKKLSIVIPVYNEEKSIIESVTSLLNLKYPKYEVIVVNDGGIDVQSVVNTFDSQLELTLHNQNNSGPAKARNKGAHLSNGKFIAFTDDDCSPSTNWLQELTRL